MATEQQPAEPQTSSEQKDPQAPESGGGIGGFLADNAGMLILGILALLAFVFAGPLVGLLALLGGGAAMMFMGDKVQEAGHAVARLAGLEPTTPAIDQRGTGVELTQQLGSDTEKPKAAKMKIDGREYDVTVDYKNDKAKIVAEKFTYKPVDGGEEKVFTPKTPIEIGSITADGVNIDQAKVLAAGGKLLDEVRADGAKAIKDAGMSGLNKQDNDTYAVKGDKGKDTYVVQVTEGSNNKSTVALYDVNGKPVNGADGNPLQSVDVDTASLAREGVLAREVGKLMTKVAGDPASMVLDGDKVKAVRIADIKTDISSLGKVDEPQGGKLEGDLKLNGNDATYSLNTRYDEKEGKHYVTGGTITPKDGVPVEFKPQKEVAIGQAKLNGTERVYENIPGALEKVLKDGVEKEERDIVTRHEKNLQAVPSAVMGEQKFYLNESRAYLISVDQTSGAYKLTDVATSETKDGQGVGNDVQATLRIALKDVEKQNKDGNVLTKSADAVGAEKHALMPPMSTPVKAGPSGVVTPTRDL